MLTKKDLYNLCNGAIEIIDENALLEKINAGKKLIIKHGIDPTGADLHLGHMVNYMVMRRFQNLGHKIVIVFGDFTARIGDPTGKLTSRKGMTKQEIENNIAKLKPQLLKIFDKNNLEFRRNGEWWDQINLEQFLNIAKNITATHLFERDMFQERIKLKRAIWTNEFLYPILQGYDSVMLKADVTVIGSDQKFNELIARDLQPLFNQSPQSLIIMPVLVGLDGKEKMGKTTNNYISLNDPPNEIFGKIMSMPDSNISTYFKLLTSLSDSQLNEMEKLIKSNPLKAKMKLAFEITSFFYKNNEAVKAQNFFVKTFQKKKLPQKNIPTIKINISQATNISGASKMKIVDLLVSGHLCASKSEAKRLIQEGAVKINAQKIKDVSYVIKASDLPIILQKGKHVFLKIVKE